MTYTALPLPVVAKETKELRARSDAFATDDALTCFLYLLMRDRLIPGHVEALVREAAKIGRTTLTNGYMARYAEDCAVRLRPNGDTDGS